MDTKEKRRPGTPGRKPAHPVGKAPGRKPAPKRPTRPAARVRQEPRRQPPRRKAAPAARKPRQKRPEIIYTPAKPFSRNRFLLRLTTAVAVVLALTFVLSVFFKVKTVTVSGANLYTPYTVMEASGIREGDNLLSIGKASAYAKIKVALPYVESVRIGIKLPDTVNIGIVEREVVYSIQAQDQSWWLISAGGDVVEKSNGAEADSHVKILGVDLAAPIQGQKAVAGETAVQAPSEPETTVPGVTDGVTVPETPDIPGVSGAIRLQAALDVLKGIEKHGLVQQTASVDVSEISELKVMYGTRFEVRLGDTTQLDYKIKCMEQAIAQMTRYQSGILDVSFTTMSDKVIYTPYE